MTKPLYQNRQVAALIPGVLRLEMETASYIAANALDFLMTWFLLSYQSPTGAVYVESNPIACFFLGGWGVQGLLAFKLAMVGCVAAVCQIIAAQREEIARRVLQFAVIIVILVVAYSGILLLQNG